MTSYFIAIITPDEVDQHVLEWKKYMLQQFNCKKALRLPAHITLIPPFTMQRSLEMSMVHALEKFAGHQPAFQVHLKDFAAFVPRVIYVQVEAGEVLVKLKRGLEDLLLQVIRVPIKKEERAFHPHVTIASHDLKGKDFAAAWACFEGRRYDAVFEAGVISLLVNKGAGWERVEDFLLG
jgi:2'-5' RNA ligase